MVNAVRFLGPTRSSITRLPLWIIVALSGCGEEARPVPVGEPADNDADATPVSTLGGPSGGREKPAEPATKAMGMGGTMASSGGSETAGLGTGGSSAGSSGSGGTGAGGSGAGGSGTGGSGSGGTGAGGSDTGGSGAGGAGGAFSCSQFDPVGVGAPTTDDSTIVAPDICDSNAAFIEDTGFATIQAAINAAKASEVISICPGTHVEQLTTSLTTLTLESATRDASTVTIQAGDPSDRLLDSGFKVILRDLTFFGANDAVRAPEVDVSGCVFEENDTGIRLSNSHNHPEFGDDVSLVVVDSSFRTNGSGIRAGGTDKSVGTLDVRTTTFDDNVTAISLAASVDLSVDSTLFWNNRWGLSASCSLFHIYPCTAHVRNSHFEKNHTALRWYSGGTSSWLTLEGSLIRANGGTQFAPIDIGNGHYGSLVELNCVQAEDNFGKEAGVIWMGDGLNGYRYTLNVTDSLFARNKSEKGGVANLSVDGKLSFNETRFEHNTATLGSVFYLGRMFDGTQNLSLSNSVFENNTASAPTSATVHREEVCDPHCDRGSYTNNDLFAIDTSWGEGDDDNSPAEVYWNGVQYSYDGPSTFTCPYEDICQ